MNQSLDPVNELRAIGSLLADCQAHITVAVSTAESLGFPVLSACLQRALDALRAADEENLRLFSELKDAASS
jgi:hypothetical protein